jgi:broad specificity phosphatase PhoE
MNRSLVYLGAAVLFAVAWAAPQAVPEEASRASLKRPVIVAIVRHAEKDDEGQDPGLTAAGKVRATRLAALFRKSKLDLLIASDLKRTRETLEPVAKEKSMKISAIKEPGDVARAIKALRPGSTALVAHHSFSIRALLKELGVSDAEAGAIDLDSHDNLLIVPYHADVETKSLTLSY